MLQPGIAGFGDAILFRGIGGFHQTEHVAADIGQHRSDGFHRLARIRPGVAVPDRVALGCRKGGQCSAKLFARLRGLAGEGDGMIGGVL